MNKKTNFSNVNLVFEELEPRLLLSADPLAVITESSVATVQELVPGNDETKSFIVQQQAEQPSVVVQAKPNKSELVIIDSRAPNFQQLHNDIINSQQQGRNIHVVVLDAHRNGIDQISEILKNFSNLDVVHIVSHGSAGQLELGATQLNKTTLQLRTADIIQWGEVFTEEADVQIYGCDLAIDPEGRELVDELARLTQTDVAASDDLTGQKLLGGDWELEYHTGEIESQIAFSEAAQQNWQATLATNVAPINSVPAVQVTSQDTDLIFSSGNSNQISISDADAGAAEVEVSLTATNGTVNLVMPSQLASAAGSETRVNTSITGTQATPWASPQSVAMAPDGSYVALFSGEGPGDTSGLFMQRFAADGTTLGSNTLVNTYTTGGQGSGAIAMDEVGNYVVTWVDDNQDGSGNGIYAQRFNSDGTSLGTEFKVNDYVTGGQDAPSIAMAANGDFVISWSGQGATDNAGVYAKRFDSVGVAQGAEFQVNTFDSGNDQSYSQVAMNASGEFIITWQSRAQDAGMSYGIFAQRYDASGNTVGSEFQVNSHFMGHQTYPSIDMDDEANFVIAWNSVMNATDGDGTGIFAQRYDANGNTVGSEFMVNTYITNNQSYPVVTMNGSGEFSIAWVSTGQDGSGSGAYMQQYDANGNTKGSEILVNTVTTNNTQGNASIAMNSIGDIVVLWSGEGTGDITGVFTQRYEVASSLTLTAGNGIDDSNITLTGAIADINTALEGMTFTPDAGFNGVASIQMMTDDLGNTGTGGAKTDGDTVNITVGTGNAVPTGVDDAAVASEDGTLNVSASGILSNDIDIDAIPKATAGTNLNFDAANDDDSVWNDENATAGFDWTITNFATESTHTNSPTTAYSGITSAYQFSGTNSGATMDIMENMVGNPTNNSASFEVWFRTDTLAGQHVIFEAGGSQNGTSIYLDGSNLNFATRTSGAVPDEVSIDLSTLYADPTAEFIQVVGVIDQTNNHMQLFVDGTLQGTTIFTATNGSRWGNTQRNQ